MSNPYLVKLEQLLQDIPQEEREEILQDYREHFRLAQAEGKTPEEIAGSLGAPEALAADILAEYRFRAIPPEAPSATAKSYPRWRKMAIPAICALLFLALVWALVDIRAVPSSSSPSPAASPSPSPSLVDTVAQLNEALKAYAAGASPEAKKPGGTVTIQEERKATGEIRSVRVETVDTQVIIETAKDAKPQALLDGQIAVREGEDWTDYYEFGADSSGDTFRVFVKPTEAKKQQMPQGRSTTLRIRLPEAPMEDLEVATVSGSVKGPSLQVSYFSGTSVSGNIDLAGLKGKSHNLANVSGKISVGGLSGDFGVESVSGNVQITGASWESSGSVNTISGNVNLTADAKLPFAYELSSITGSVSCGYEGAATGKLKRQCSGTTGESKRSLTLTSISGPLHVGPVN